MFISLTLLDDFKFLFLYFENELFYRKRVDQSNIAGNFVSIPCPACKSWQMIEQAQLIHTYLPRYLLVDYID